MHKTFMGPAKALRPPPPTYLMYSLQYQRTWFHLSQEFTCIPEDLKSRILKFLISTSSIKFIKDLHGFDVELL